MNRWSASVDIPATDRAPATARHLIASLLPAWDLDDLTADAQLIASELVTNAYRHAVGSTTLELHLTQRGSGVRIGLADGSSIKPVITELSNQRTSGRGLRIVAALCTEWGSDTRDDGKEVWADLDRD